MQECPQCGYDLDEPEVSGLTFVYATRMLYHRKKSVKLTRRQMHVIEYLIDAGLRGCTADYLIEGIYNDGSGNALQIMNNQTLCVHVSNLRKLIAPLGFTISADGKGYGTCRYTLRKLTCPMATRKLSLMEHAS